MAAAARGSTSLDLQAARAFHGVRLAQLDLSLALESGRARTVLSSLERWIAATDRMPSVRASDDPQLAAMTETLRVLWATRRDESDNRIPVIEEKIAQTQDDIRRRTWMLSQRESAAGVRPADIDRAISAVGERGRTFVWLFTRGDRVMGLGVRAGRLRVRDLASRGAITETASRLRADFRMTATRQLGAMGAAVWSSLRSSAAALDDDLIRPWLDDDHGVVIVPSQDLSAITWSVLPSLHQRPVTIARSLSGWAGRASESSHVSAVAFAGPRLVRAVGEADEVARTWNHPQPRGAVDIRRARPRPRGARCRTRRRARPT